MCGRFAAFREAQDLADVFDLDDVAPDAAALLPSWNLAPTDPVRIVVERAKEADDAVRSLRVVRWGLVPGWAKDPSIGTRMINARMESLADKPAFRRALAARRCLVPVEGYYAWQQPPEGSPRRTPKQPFWIHPADGAPLALAGLYEFWRDRSLPDDDPNRWLVTMTVITGDALSEGGVGDGPALADIHDRRPVVLSPDAWNTWLDPSAQDPRAAFDLLAAAADSEPTVQVTPVATTVNRVGTDGPELIEPLADGDRSDADLGLELPDRTDRPRDIRL